MAGGFFLLKGVFRVHCHQRVAHRAWSDCWGSFVVSAVFHILDTNTNTSSFAERGKLSGHGVVQVEAPGGDC